MHIKNSSMGKALCFKDDAEAEGWNVEIEEVAPEEVHVYCTRNGEEVYIWWRDNQLLETPKYNYNGAQISLHNTATATRHLAKKPDAALAAKRLQRKQKARTASVIIADEEITELKIEEMQLILPFDIYESSNSEILAAIRGSTLVWANAMTGKVETEYVPYIISKGNKKSGDVYMNTDLKNVFKLVVGRNDRDYISFMNANGIFRAVYLDRILQVI